MTYYLFSPVLLFLLVIIQVTILDLFSFGWIEMEISIIVVIYAGFHLDVFRGAILSFLLGFFMDCLTSTVFGCHLFLYMVIYGCSMIVGERIYAGKPSLIAFFTGFCTLLKGMMIILIYRFFFGSNLLHEMPTIFVPQALVLGFLSPILFNLFQRFEVLLNVEDRQPSRRI
jgi:rod shape-determining protein MreD